MFSIENYKLKSKWILFLGVGFYQFIDYSGHLLTGCQTGLFSSVVCFVDTQVSFVYLSILQHQLLTIVLELVNRNHYS